MLKRKSQNQNHPQREHVLPKGQNHQLKSLLNTQKRTKNARVGGTSPGMIVPVAPAKHTSSAGGPCTSTATRRRRRGNLRLGALVFATISGPCLGKGSPALLTMMIRTVPGAALVGTSAPRTRLLALIPRQAADVQIVKIRTTARVSKVTASTSQPVMSMLNASLRRRSVATSPTGSVNARKDSKETAFSAWMEMVP